MAKLNNWDKPLLIVMLLSIGCGGNSFQGKTLASTWYDEANEMVINLSGLRFGIQTRVNVVYPTNLCSFDLHVVGDNSSGTYSIVNDLCGGFEGEGIYANDGKVLRICQDGSCYMFE